jgi:hypothetical protein
MTRCSLKGTNVSKELEACTGLHSTTFNNIFTLIHCRVHKNRPLVPVLCLTNPVHKINFNIIPFLRLGLSSHLVPSGITN